MLKKTTNRSVKLSKCYSINPDRAPYSGWMNNDARDRWWWREVSCGGGNEGSNGCPPSNSFLQKKSMFEKDSENSNEDISYEVWGKNTKFYDALGRKTQARPETRRYLFAPKKHIIDSKIKGYSESGLLRVLPDGKECGVLRGDYGIILDNGQRKGGVTCVYFDVSYNYRENLPDTLKDGDCYCSNNSELFRITGTFSYTLSLTINEIYYVNKGFVFKDGYVTTERDRNAIREHELKHQQDNASIIRGQRGTIPIDTIVCENNLQSFRMEIQKKLLSDTKNEYHAKIKAANDDFHEKCYIEKLYEFCE